MANKKQLAAMGGAVLLTAVLAVGGTLAYLSSVTETAKNKFTSSKNINGNLVEEGWGFGEDGWQDWTPGDSHAKDPKIALDKGNEDAYAAMKVVCYDNDNNEISFAEFQTKYAEVSYKGVKGINTANWEEDAAHKGFYYYKTALTNGTTSEALFDTVTVNTGIKTVYTNTSATQVLKTYKIDQDGNKTLVETVTGKPVLIDQNMKVYEVVNGKEVDVTGSAKLPKFQIDVTGYAIQKTGNESNYKVELAKLAGF